MGILTVLWWVFWWELLEGKLVMISKIFSKAKFPRTSKSLFNKSILKISIPTNVTEKVIKKPFKNPFQKSIKIVNLQLYYFISCFKIFIFFIKTEKNDQIVLKIIIYSFIIYDFMRFCLFFEATFFWGSLPGFVSFIV